MYTKHLLTTFAISARGRAAVARRAHNPKVIGSIPVLATPQRKSAFLLTFSFLCLEQLVKPEFIPVIEKLRAFDPHDLVRPDSWFQGSANARG